MKHDEITLSLEEVRTLAMRVLTGAGLSAVQAGPVADVITRAERDECRSHGLYRLPGCVETIRFEKFNPLAEPVVEDVSASLVRVDAGFGYSLLAFDQGRPLLERKARQYGLAALAINNCFHFSALWSEVEVIAGSGLAAVAMTPSHAWVAPAGGTRPALGTNPLAFAWPRPGGHPYVFDFATSAIARGDIALHDIMDKPVPEGWGLDGRGQPTTQASEILSGAMLTFGGHKGSALSTMVELMAGPLIGDMTSLQSLDFDAGAKAAPCHGELILAFCPQRMGLDGQAGTQAAEALFGTITSQGARLPSQRRYEARQRSERRGSVNVPRVLMERIQSLVL